jgi:cytochrome c
MKFTITEHSTQGELLSTDTKKFKTVESLVDYIEERKRMRDKVDVTSIGGSPWLQITKEYFPF